MIRALFLDVDGTLVSFRTHRIAPSAVAALKEARGRGVGVFLSLIHISEPTRPY